jgi:hypothetical protein
MNVQKIDKIQTFTHAVKTMTASLDDIASVGLTMTDVKTVMMVLDPSSLSLIDKIAKAFTVNENEQITVAPLPATEEPKQPIVIETKPEPIQKETQETKTTKHPNAYTDADIEEICKVFVEEGCSSKNTLITCSVRKIRCSGGTLSWIKTKKKWSEISDKYFVLDKDGNPVAVRKEEKKEEPKKPVFKSTQDRLTKLDPMLFDYVVNQLTAEHGSIKKVFKKAVDNGRKLEIYDVFNIKYDGKRDKPVRSEDIDVIIRHIAADKMYSIPTIEVALKERCDVILDGKRVNLIIDLAKKAGKEVHNTKEHLTRDKKPGEDDDPIEHFEAIEVELSRLGMDTYQAWHHLRPTSIPVPMEDVYRVKQYIGTPTESDVSQLCVYFQRNRTLDYAQISNILHESLGIVASANEVKEYVREYYDKKYMRAAQKK